MPPTRRNKINNKFILLLQMNQILPDETYMDDAFTPTFMNMKVNMYLKIDLRSY